MMTFVHLRGIAQKHAEVKEYIKERNSSIGEMLQPAGKKRHKKDEADQTRTTTEETTCKARVASGPNTPI